MLYVFQVDTGTMMTFEMRLAMEKVGNLKRAIAQRTEIPEDKQVLLISGGESLNNMQPVCSYSSAGTDTSPIFLFAKVNIESNSPPSVNIDYDDDRDIMEMIESCLSMQPSLDTLVARTELAADLNEQAAKKRESCERLVHEQHLQQQGWAAVTANLEDLTRAFKNKSELLISAFTQFTKHRSMHEQLLQEFCNDIERLDSVPILPLLLEDNKYLTNMSTSTKSGSCDIDTSTRKQQNQEFSKNDIETTDAVKDSEDENSSPSNEQPYDQNATNIPSEDAESTATTNEDETKQSEDEFLDANQEETSDKQAYSSSSQTANTTAIKLPPSSTSTAQKSDEQHQSSMITLRRWIDFHDSHNSLEKLIELCWRGLERFSEANAEQVRHEVQELLKQINDINMKVIKGLEERLFTLDKLMDETKKVVEDQCQLAASFQNNRERFSKVKDSSLLPDLSVSHKQQLQIMLNNHHKMINVKDRCIKAKLELCASLHLRLRWIMYIEQQISDLDGKLMIYRENLCRLQRHFEIVEQVHRAPDLYLESVVEASRRRRFTKRYLHWANSVAKISQKLYENEMSIRRAFDEKLDNHFLSSLFPGMSRSYPPPFATKQPDPFDTNLPRITAADIQFLQANISDELAKNLYIPRDIHMPHVISALTAMNIDEDNATAEKPSCNDDEDEDEDEDTRHSLNPTPPSSPTTVRPQTQQ